MQVATFQRLYEHGSGLVHEATPAFVANVLRSMNEAASSDVPFRVRLVMVDGSAVIVRPKASNTKHLGSPIHGHKLSHEPAGVTLQNRNTAQ